MRWRRTTGGCFRLTDLIRGSRTSPTGVSPRRGVSFHREEQTMSHRILHAHGRVLSGVAVLALTVSGTALSALSAEASQAAGARPAACSLPSGDLSVSDLRA